MDPKKYLFILTFKFTTGNSDSDEIEDGIYELKVFSDQELLTRTQLEQATKIAREETKGTVILDTCNKFLNE